MNRDRYVLEVLLAAVGGDNHLAQFSLPGNVHRGLAQHTLGGEDADAVRCEVLEAQSGTLEQASERFIGTQSRGSSVGSAVTHETRDIDDLQAGLTGERCKRLRERPRGNVGSERSGFEDLG